MRIGILLPASEIPEGKTVHKKTGTKLYTLKKSIRVFGKDRQEISCSEGVVFLVADNLNIDGIVDDTILVWCTTEKDYFSFLEDKFMDDH